MGWIWYPDEQVIHWVLLQSRQGWLYFEAHVWQVPDVKK
jgi:hypothetical protein